MSRAATTQRPWMFTAFLLRQGNTVRYISEGSKYTGLYKQQVLVVSSTYVDWRTAAWDSGVQRGSCDCMQKEKQYIRWKSWCLHPMKLKKWGKTLHMLFKQIIRYTVVPLSLIAPETQPCYSVFHLSYLPQTGINIDLSIHLDSQCTGFDTAQHSWST